MQHVFLHFHQFSSWKRNSWQDQRLNWLKATPSVKQTLALETGNTTTFISCLIWKKEIPSEILSNLEILNSAGRLALCCTEMEMSFMGLRISREFGLSMFGPTCAIFWACCCSDSGRGRTPWLSRTWRYEPAPPATRTSSRLRAGTSSTPALPGKSSRTAAAPKATLASPTPSRSGEPAPKTPCLLFSMNGFNSLVLEFFFVLRNYFFMCFFSLFEKKKYHWRKHWTLNIEQKRKQQRERTKMFYSNKSEAAWTDNIFAANSFFMFYPVSLAHAKAGKLPKQFQHDVLNEIKLNAQFQNADSLDFVLFLLIRSKTNSLKSCFEKSAQNAFGDICCNSLGSAKTCHLSFQQQISWLSILD